MKPVIDISQVAHLPAFVTLDRTFGLAERLNLYHNVASDQDALGYVEAMINVLTRGSNGDAVVLERELGDAAGTALTALEQGASGQSAGYAVQHAFDGPPAGPDALKGSGSGRLRRHRRSRPAPASGGDPGARRLSCR